MTESKLRQALVDSCRELERLQINQGTAGNIAIRTGDAMLITPSGVPYDRLTAAMIVRMPLAQVSVSSEPVWQGSQKPSSEWRMHRDILCAKPDAGAVVHTHSIHATALSMLGEEIPAAHYMIAAFGGPNVRCTAYAPYGTQDLSDLVVAGLRDRHGVLLGQHGMVVTGADLGQAMWRAVELETLAKMYVIARSIGQPRILSDAEIERTVERFKSYGYQSAVTALKPPRRPAPAKTAARPGRK